MLSLALLLVLPSHAAEVARVPAAPSAPHLIVPASVVPPLVRPDGSDIHSDPQILLPPGSVRLEPGTHVLTPDHPATAPLVDALEQHRPISSMLPTGARELAADAEKPQKSAAEIAVDAMKEAGAFDGARKLEQRLAADEPFAPIKDWRGPAVATIQETLRVAARPATTPAANHAAIRGLYMKFGDRLDWTGVHDLLSRLKPAEDGSDVRQRDELLEAFVRERWRDISPVDAARAAGSVSDPATRKALLTLIGAAKPQ